MKFVLRILEQKWGTGLANPPRAPWLYAPVLLPLARLQPKVSLLHDSCDGAGRAILPATRLGHMRSLPNKNQRG